MTGNREYKSDVFSMLLEEQPEQYKLKLSDSFAHQMENPEIELTCTVYNINYGKNRELLEKCTFLRGYMIFVDYVCENNRVNGYDNLEYSIEAAIDRCIEGNVLREFWQNAVRRW